MTIAAPPPDLNGCNCTLCGKNGGLWGYFDPKNVHIVGETTGYIRRDLTTPALITHFCPTCGVVTHWSPLPSISQGRMGVNMRLFPPEVLAGINQGAGDAAGNANRPALQGYARAGDECRLPPGQARRGRW